MFNNDVLSLKLLRNNLTIYLYQVEAYWDKEKKQARQRNVYLGTKEKAGTKKMVVQGFYALLSFSFAPVDCKYSTYALNNK
jgi:hypothetical protein